MQKICRNTWCGKNFEITPEDLAFYEKVSPIYDGKMYSIPPPTLCPDCRLQRRQSWRNERSIYRRNCALCTKHFISIFHLDEPYNVVCPRCYWGNTWNPLQYGREFNFSRTFNEQFSDLLTVTPLIGVININTENSEYCNRAYGGKNNYLSFILLYDSENILYSYYTQHCKDCVDVCEAIDTELCYEVVDSEKCYRCSYSQRIRNCTQSQFLEDCTGCTNCFQCKNLRQKSYCIQNVQYSQDEYERKIAQIDVQSRRIVEEQKEIARQFFLTQPHRGLLQINCENVIGANVKNCRNSHELYDFYESENMRYCTFGERSHDCMDCYGFGEGEYCYSCNNFMRGQSNCFCVEATDCSECFYCYSCNNATHHAFGCAGLKKGEYCILNKQYTKEEYKVLVPKIIEHMRTTGEWGLGFSMTISPWAYNESDAQQYYPLVPAQAQEIGSRWRENDPREHVSPTASIPDSLQECTDALTKETFACAACTKNFKVIQQELDFHRQLSVALPSHCPDCRQTARIKKKHPRTLWNRRCAQCSKDMQTTYAPDRPEIVYCEECYLKEVY